MEALYLYLPLVLLALPVLTKYYLNKIQNLNKILNLPPSPFPTIPILGHLHLIIKNGPIHLTLSTISARYGPVLLLKFGLRRLVLISSPEATQECFTTNDAVLANGPHLMFEKHLGYNHFNIAWPPRSKRWSDLRSVPCLDIFRRLHHDPGFKDVRAGEVRHSIRQICKSVNNSAGEMKKVKMKKVLVELVLNMMMRMFAGTRCVAQQLGMSGPMEERMKALEVERDSFVQDLIDEIRGNSGSKLESPEEQKKTVIEELLEKLEDDPKKYGDDVIKRSILAMLAAGTDYSAGTLEWALSLLLNNPHVLNKAHKEIDTEVGGKRLLVESDLEKLNYLDCIIKETLRMYPAGQMRVCHESSKDCTIGGYHIPGGTMLMVNMWAIQNDPNIWEEPTKFMPERFEHKERDGFKWLPFGYGRRSCPGEGLARRMVGLALGSLIQCFEWERVGEEMVDMTEGAGLTLLKAQPLVAKCRPRQSKVNLIFKTRVFGKASTSQSASAARIAELEETVSSLKTDFQKKLEDQRQFWIHATTFFVLVVIMLILCCIYIYEA